MGQGASLQPPPGDRVPYRVPPPASDAMVDWPESFGTRFTVFVDTEEEFDWAAPLSRDQRSTRAMAALPDAHRRLTDGGAALTYMIDHPIATCPASTDILRALLADGRTAIGTQLHPWVNPPFDEAVTPANSFAGNLPRSLEAAKLTILTDTIQVAFGTRPLAYRAGRYGIGPNTLALLHMLGYRLDTSMRSGYDYSADGGPDFTAMSNHAFRTGPDGTLIELPLTTVYTGYARRLGPTLHHSLTKLPRGQGTAARLGLLARVALTPEDMPIADALEAVRIALGEGMRVLNFAFHSPSVAPGHTPYVRDAADLAQFHHWWERMLALLAKRGVASASLVEVLEAGCAPRDAAA